MSNGCAASKIARFRKVQGIDGRKCASEAAFFFFFNNAEQDFGVHFGTVRLLRLRVASTGLQAVGGRCKLSGKTAHNQARFINKFDIEGRQPFVHIGRDK